MRFKGVLLTFFLLYVCLAPVCEAAGPGSNKETLRGLKAVGVFVDLVKSPSETQGLSRNQLQNEVEAKLRRAGITVVPSANIETLPELAFIYLNLTINRLDTTYAYNADFFCLTPDQRKQANGNPAAWNMRSAGLVDDLVQVRQKVAELVNRFIKDYGAVNPGVKLGRNLKVPEGSSRRQIDCASPQQGPS